MSEAPHSWILGVEMSLLDQIRKQSNNPGAEYDHGVTDSVDSVDREAELKDMSRGDLNDIASGLGVDNPASFANKSGVISAIMDAESDSNGETDSGVEDTELDEDEVEDILNDTEDDNDTSE